MAQILNETTAKSKGIKLFSKEELFRISFEVKLDNGFELKDMTHKHIQEFHRFLQATVYKGLTISEVDELFLRKSGLSNVPVTITARIEILLEFLATIIQILIS